MGMQGGGIQEDILFVPEKKQMAVSSFSSTQISKEEAVFSSIAMAIHIPTTTQNISDNCPSSLSFFTRK